jgi:hypothetical protein
MISTPLRLPFFALLTGLAWALPLVSADEQQKAKPAPTSAAQVFKDLSITIEDNRQYLASMKKLRSYDERYRDSAEWKSFYFQLVGTGSSFVGRCGEAFAYFDRSQDHEQSQHVDADGLRGFESQDAMEAILELASQRQVLMINEAHHGPLHRAFTLRLLEGLYRKGFRYFAAETLASKDAQLQPRGYPTLRSGYYLAEPMYADLVRTALRLGYQVVPYEHEGSTSPMNSNEPPRRRISARACRLRI